MKQGEEGFTLIEIVMVIAIIALIVSAAMMATFQVVRGTERSNDHMTAVNQVQNAGYWISRDTQMAENVTAGDLTPPNFLILFWGEEESDDQYKVTYTLEVMPGIELKKVQRHLSINGVPDSTTFVAQYIDPDKTSCNFTGNKLALTVTAAGGSGSPKSETRVYEVIPRPN
ncbi:MAG TPA: prepilin-type N-terminal cleavage/methylation domain-containing protein [Dehalococcoidales bacterium]|nr:prepilin-type N-terminal cleavage/methylation domain-containing protein [Dehalococcoidales bacterium]